GLLYPALQALLFQASRTAASHTGVYSGRLAGLCRPSLSQACALPGACLTTRPPGQDWTCIQQELVSPWEPSLAHTVSVWAAGWHRCCYGTYNVRCAAVCPDGTMKII